MKNFKIVKLVLRAGVCRPVIAKRRTKAKCTFLFLHSVKFIKKACTKEKFTVARNFVVDPVAPVRQTSGPSAAGHFFK